MPKRANIYDARTKMPHKAPYQPEFFLSADLLRCSTCALCTLCTHTVVQTFKKKKKTSNENSFFVERFEMTNRLICKYNKNLGCFYEVKILFF